MTHILQQGICQLNEYFQFFRIESNVAYALMLFKSFNRFPWNQSTPIGYLGEVCCSIMPAESYLFINGVLLLLFISMCLLNRAFHDRFQYTLQMFDHSNNGQRSKTILCELIQFHNSIKE